MTRLIIVRHGESEGNKKNIFCGNTDMPLTELGKMQAQKTAEYLKSIKIDAIYSSDLCRAYVTAKTTADIQNINVIADRGLREVNGGDWEGADYLELARNPSGGFLTWMNDIDNAVCDNGEGVADMKKRITAAVDKIAKENDGKTVGIFSHASPIRALFSVWNKKTMKGTPWVKNASVTIVEYESIDCIKFIMTDYVGHLENMVTFLPDCI